ncbi:endonuclease III [Thermoleophilum album]|jgi:endonuclease-3|uniref:endonuclease III domain-containing protein n=1 Tax=Thermoleophilum album TaxID=29539 RepID=UPI00237C8BFB|nr:endonuclease III [Thermoleophilum album]WDT93781.1 endonuclease III [Thermoleophilum album]
MTRASTSSTRWRRPPRRRVAEIVARLRCFYGAPRLRPHGRPLDELVLTVLSQNTSDRNRDVAYVRLREAFPAWSDVRAAPVEAIEAAIRPGGLAPTKARRIRAILDAIGDDDLAWLADAPVAQARAFLCSLPGVGRKTAACVLLFSFGRPEVPVDTHVHRVATRLGLLPAGVPLEAAHDIALRYANDFDPYEFHVLLIRHGRRLCAARNPKCGSCPLRSLCPTGR